MCSGYLLQIKPTASCAPPSSLGELLVAVSLITIFMCLAVNTHFPISCCCFSSLDKLNSCSGTGFPKVFFFPQLFSSAFFWVYSHQLSHPRTKAMVEFESQQHRAGWSNPGALTLLQPCMRLALSQAASSHWLIQSAAPSYSWVLHTQVQSHLFPIHTWFLLFKYNPLLFFVEFDDFHFSPFHQFSKNICNLILAGKSLANLPMVIQSQPLQVCSLFLDPSPEHKYYLDQIHGSTPKTWLWTDKIEQDVSISSTFILKGFLSPPYLPMLAYPNVMQSGSKIPREINLKIFVSAPRSLVSCYEHYLALS